MKKFFCIVALICMIARKKVNAQVQSYKMPAKAGMASRKFIEIRRKEDSVKAIKKISANDLRMLMDTSTGPLIINFWASWCGPCIREIPWFDSLIEKSGKPVKLLLVSLDFPEDYAKKLPAFVKKQQYKGEVVYLDERNADYFIPAIDKKWSGAIPASIFVNNSKKYYELFNYQLTVKRFELELNKLIN